MSNKGWKRKREAVAFELNPPRCINCTHYEPPMFGVPGKVAYLPARCEQGGFTVLPHSICDQWTGRAGETLEATP